MNKKYVVIVPDGAADYPLEQLGNKTPLQIAKKPNIDFLAKNGKTGKVKTVPDTLSPGSDVANLSLLGYDPVKYYSGRGPLEAVNMGIKLEESDVAFRCNLITIKDGVLLDYSAGHITTEEAKILIETINEKLGSDKIKFYPGISYRHLMIFKDFGDIFVNCTPPHDVVGESYEKNLPTGKDAKVLINLIDASRSVLDSCDLNKERISENKNPANSIWLWGQGKAPSMPSFLSRFNLKGSIISAVDLINGIGRCIGLNVIKVPGATGYFDTNYKGKATYALNFLEENDFVFIHIEAPDEAGHIGDINAKIESIEKIDELVVGTVLEGLKKYPDYKIMIVPDHATPIKTKTHSGDPVPFLIYSNSNEHKNSKSSSFDEFVNEEIYIDKGYELMKFFLKEGK